MKSFDDISEQFSTWIIKYCSPTIDKALFLVWYTDTDENRTDRLLTIKSGDIFATTSLVDMKGIITSERSNLNQFENLSPWLESFDNVEAVESSTYDLYRIITSLQNKQLDVTTIEGFADFVNLFGDFVNQDPKNKHLQIYLDNELIKQTWNYFYDFIFWARFNDKEKFETWDRPHLEIDTSKLLSELKFIIEKFDERLALR